MIRNRAIPALVVLALIGTTFTVVYLKDDSPALPGWILMGFALAGLLLVLDLPRIIRAQWSIKTLLEGLDETMRNGDHDLAEEILVIARNKVGTTTGNSNMQMHMQLDLAEGTILFRQGRYEEAYYALERCFLNAFAVNDAKHGAESGVMLLKSLVALGRYQDACQFALGVRALADTPEVEDLVALAGNRLNSCSL